MDAQVSAPVAQGERKRRRFLTLDEQKAELPAMKAAFEEETREDRDAYLAAFVKKALDDDPDNIYEPLFGNVLANATQRVEMLAKVSQSCGSTDFQDAFMKFRDVHNAYVEARKAFMKTLERDPSSGDRIAFRNALTFLSVNYTVARETQTEHRETQTEHRETQTEYRA